MPIETTDSRADLIRKIVLTIATGSFVVGGAVGGEYFLNPDIQLYNQMVTGSEYDQLKPELIGVIKQRKERGISIDQLEMWKSMANIEMAKCGQLNLTNVTVDGLIEKINQTLEQGKCSN